MSAIIKQLRAMTDDEIIAAHDALAKHAAASVMYYLDELRHRDLARREQRMVVMTGAIVVLTLINTVFVGLAALHVI